MVVVMTAAFFHILFYPLGVSKVSVEVKWYSIIDNVLTYKVLQIEIERMCGMKAMTILVVIGALGLVKKGMEKFTQQIPSNVKIQELQKITLLGTLHIPIKALPIK